MEGLNKPFKYMHNNNLIHRDIKLDNIMIKFIDDSKTKFIPKVADYGLARELDKGTAETCLGTEGYMAPEIYKKMGNEDDEDLYNDKSDLYSIGVMMYKLYFSSFPFKNYNKAKTQKKRLDCEDKVLDDLLNKLLVYEPEKRISWEDYFNHPFLNQIQIKI